MLCVDGITVWEAESAWNIMQMMRLIYFFLKISQHPHREGGFPLSWPETLQPMAEPGALLIWSSIPQNRPGVSLVRYPRSSKMVPALWNCLEPQLRPWSCMTFHYPPNLSGPPAKSDLLVLWGLNELIHRKYLEQYLTCQTNFGQYDIFITAGLTENVSVTLRLHKKSWSLITLVIIILLLF